MTKDYPSSNAHITIADKNQDTMCIQVIGEPQSILETIGPVSERTKYEISFQGDTIFEGTIKEVQNE
jgi:hypothetical protein